MARHRTYSLEFKRLVAQQYLSGEFALAALAHQHDMCRSLIRIWVAKYEAGEFDDFPRLRLEPSRRGCYQPANMRRRRCEACSPRLRGSADLDCERSVRVTLNTVPSLTFASWPSVSFPSGGWPAVSNRLLQVPDLVFGLTCHWMKPPYGEPPWVHTIHYIASY